MEYLDSDKHFQSKEYSKSLSQQSPPSLSTCTTFSCLEPTDKRNIEFHSLFPSIPSLELLIQDYSCAWQREVLIQGRLYVTSTALYFYSKIIWIYSIKIPFADILSIEKTNDSVVGIFPNSLQIKTKTQKMFFASFINRDSAYETIEKIRNVFNTQNHTIPLIDFQNTPSVSKNENSLLENQNSYPHTLDPLAIPINSHNLQSLETNSPQFIRRRHHSLDASFERPKTHDVSSLRSKSSLGLLSSNESLSQSSDPNHESINPLLSNIQQSDIHIPQDSEIHEQPIELLTVSSGPVLCDCDYTLDKMKTILDHVLDAPLDKIWSILFSTPYSDKSFYKPFWENVLFYLNVKSSLWMGQDSNSNLKQLSLEEIQTGYTRKLEYLVPFSNPFGPSKIETFVNEIVESKDAENKYICIVQKSQTPNVTAGDCFEIEVKICLSFETRSTTRMRVSCKVNYLKTTWLKVAIEKAGSDALNEYYSKFKIAIDEYLIQNQKDMAAAEDSIRSNLLSLEAMESIRLSPPLPFVKSHLLESLNNEKIHYSHDFKLHPLENELKAMENHKKQSIHAETLKRMGSAIANSIPISLNGFERAILFFCVVSILISIFFNFMILNQLKELGLEIKNLKGHKA